ncbi:MAG: PleD family two-component system response regulator [Magnetococcales bacterium]|nr:PleD family two-component system response regulator [Magnetococcales bacterium]
MAVKAGTILIVDDERFNITVLKDLLDPHYDTMVAKNGKQALDRVASANLPDLILLDVMMPEMDGYEVCEQLKKEPRTAAIPVIFITALNQAGDESKGLKLGAIDYITKPFSPELVLLRVRNHIQFKLMSDQFRDMATLDGLTGIANRRRFDLFLEQEWRRAMRSRSPLSLILMDIDFFKPFNDNYGHSAGDECLKKVGKALHNTLTRSTDLVARYGGEEFVSVLPDTTLEGAIKFGELLRLSVSDLQVPHAHSQVTDHVTMSLGVVTLTPTQENKPEDLITSADEKLYLAKEQGRNRLVS